MKNDKKAKNSGNTKGKRRRRGPFSRMSEKQALLADIGLGALCAVLLAVLIAMPFNINLKYITFDGVKTDSLKSRTANVSELLSELTRGKKYTTTSNDIVRPGRTAKTKNDLDLSILKAVVTTAKIKGKNTTICLYPGTVKENLKYNNIKFDDNDRIKPSLDTEVTPETMIEMNEVIEKTRTATEVVKAEDKVELSSKVQSGTIKTVEGRDGKAVFEYKTVYVNGKKEKTVKTVKRWIKKKVDQQLIFGTSETGENGKVSYSRTFTGNCTAYYMGDTAVGAAGTRCHYGTCAVDPSFVPYGTKLYVTGYGIAVANDCGGAVKNNVVDLYMHNNGEALRWGRRHVKVYVLG